ncbi:hypothetical protein Agub_g5134 [Astrephomene gubernaculifera]|uniref:rRNA methyltransferase 1, mitochondrial n=1 Tax=Astrephomene gubernaculifera TaxID=47775 RepID=A0AAD3DMS2_9CHLO|nr:hypothetical protein Agub_g5134 [Astrephomene gubernaculifera]
MQLRCIPSTVPVMRRPRLAPLHAGRSSSSTSTYSGSEARAGRDEQRNKGRDRSRGISSGGGRSGAPSRQEETPAPGYHRQHRDDSSNTATADGGRHRSSSSAGSGPRDKVASPSRNGRDRYDSGVVRRQGNSYGNNNDGRRVEGGYQGQSGGRRDVSSNGRDGRDGGQSGRRDPPRQQQQREEEGQRRYQARQGGRTDKYPKYGRTDKYDNSKPDMRAEDEGRETDDRNLSDDSYEAEEEEYEHAGDEQLEEAEGNYGSPSWSRRYPRTPSGSAGGGSTTSIRDTLQGQALYGVFPVLAALRAKRRQVHRAFLHDSLDLGKRKDAGLLRQVQALCAEAGVEVARVGRHDLNLLAQDRPHQGLVLDVSPLEWTSLEEFPEASQVAAAAAAAGGAPPVWLALDEVVDPQNLGAVVRSAYCLGAAGVLACARNCAPLSPVVSKASAGSLEVLQLHSCRNLPRTLLDARDNKGWRVLGAAAGSGSQPVGQVRVDGPTILVLGSEGFGLRTNVRRACSGLVRVDMAPQAATGAVAAAAGAANTYNDGVQQQELLRGLVDSLNVSVATGILLHSLLNSAVAVEGRQ